MALLIEVPGWRRLELAHLLLDLNGTLALDGGLLPGVRPAIERLSQSLTCHLVTADTFGTAAGLLGDAARLALIAAGDEEKQKAALVDRLGPGQVAAMGNGANDAGMLSKAALGIAMLGPEGAARAALGAADVVVGHPLAGLELLLSPRRLVATLRR